MNYRIICKALDFKYKGIKLYPLISPMISHLVRNDINGKRQSSLRNLFYSYNIQEFKRKKEDDYILFTRGDGVRQNHNEWCDFYEKAIGEGISSYSRLDLESKYCFHPVLAIHIFIKILWIMRKFDYPLMSKIDICLALIRYCNTIEELDYQDFAWVKKYVSFLYPHGLGSLLTQFFKLHNVETIALTDGVYFDFKDDSLIDAVNYLDFMSDKLVMWGQYSVDEFSKLGLPKEKLYVGGYSQDDKIYPVKNPNNFKKCCVLLSRDRFKCSNLKLLDILSKFTDKYDFSFKLHPLSDIKTYQSIIERNNMKMIDKTLSLNKCIGTEIFDFAIIVNSNSYYEALSKGLPSLRFSDGSFKLMNGLDDIFEDSESFLKKMQILQNTDVDEYQKKVRDMLVYTMGIGINNYRKIIIGNE